MYLSLSISLGISLLFLFVTVAELFSCKYFENFFIFWYYFLISIIILILILFNSNSLSFFWKYISFFRYFFMSVLNCFCIILLWFFWNFVNYCHQFYYQPNSPLLWIGVFEIALNTFVADCFAWLKSFWLYLPLTFLLLFLPISLPIFFAKDKNSQPSYKYYISSLNWITH